MPGLATNRYYGGTSDLAYDPSKYGDEMDASRNPNFEFDQASGVYKPKQVGIPQWKVSPTGQVYQAYSTQSGGSAQGWNDTGQNAFSALQGVASGSMSGSGGAGGAGGGYSPSADDEAAETAARTASKENAALRLQAGLRGLKNVYSQRGISQSGLFADEAAGLFADSNAEEAGTDRDIIQRRSQRAASVADRNFNANTQLQIAQMQQAAAERSRITNLLMQFGMRY